MFFSQVGMTTLRLLPLSKFLQTGLMTPLTQSPLLLPVGKVGRAVGWGMTLVMLSALIPRHTMSTLTTVFSHMENLTNIFGIGWLLKFRERLGQMTVIFQPT